MGLSARPDAPTVRCHRRGSRSYGIVHRSGITLGLSWFAYVSGSHPLPEPAQTLAGVVHGAGPWFRQDRTGAKERRCSSQGPKAARACRCCGVP